MAGHMLQFLLFLLTATTLLHSGCSIRLEIIPESVNVLLATEVTITCYINGTSPIGVGKMDEPALVSVFSRGLREGPGMGDNMRSSGYVEVSSHAPTFARLTISRPTVQDSGEYVCSTYYQGELHQVSTSSARLTISNDTRLNDVVQYLTERMASLEALLQTQQDENNQLQARLAMQETINSRTLEFIRTERIRSAFVATVTGAGQGYEYNEIVVYTDIKLNLGNHYNNRTGLYTAPAYGLYVFHVLGTTTERDREVDVALRVNTVTASRMFTNDADYRTQASMSVVCQLWAGDNVAVYVRHRLRPDPMVVYQFPFSAFSGYLIHTLVVNNSGA